MALVRRVKIKNNFFQKRVAMYAVLVYNNKAVGKVNNLQQVIKYRGVEQLVARRAHNPKVVGSSPASATKETQFPIWEAVFFLVLEIEVLGFAP